MKQGEGGGDWGANENGEEKHGRKYWSLHRAAENTQNQTLLEDGTEITDIERRLLKMGPIRLQDEL